MKKGIILTIFSFLLLTACIKEKKTTYLRWDDTECADPWDNNKFDGIEDFLKKEGIAFKEVFTYTDSTKIKGCEACWCTTGKVYKIAVRKKDAAKMKEIGFYQ